MRHRLENLKAAFSPAHVTDRENDKIFGSKTKFFSQTLNSGRLRRFLPVDKVPQNPDFCRRAKLSHIHGPLRIEGHYLIGQI